MRTRIDPYRRIIPANIQIKDDIDSLAVSKENIAQSIKIACHTSPLRAKPKENK